MRNQQYGELKKRLNGLVVKTVKEQHSFGEEIYRISKELDEQIIQYIQKGQAVSEQSGKS